MNWNRNIINNILDVATERICAPGDRFEEMSIKEVKDRKYI